MPAFVPAFICGVADRPFIRQVPSGRRVVLVIDALNQLDEAKNAQQLYWLPWKFPANFKLLASCIDEPGRETPGRDEPVLKAFAQREHIRVPVEPLADAAIARGNIATLITRPRH
jgi:hypothetical protein